MNSTSVNSSKQASNEEVKIEWKFSGGLFNADEKEKKLEVNEKESSGKPFQIFELVSKTAGKNSVQKNEKGETVRIDEKGTKYITRKDGKIKVSRNTKTVEGSKNKPIKMTRTVEEDQVI